MNGPEAGGVTTMVGDVRDIPRQTAEINQDNVYSGGSPSP